jgi:hypothetical protein
MYPYQIYIVDFTKTPEFTGAFPFQNAKEAADDFSSAGWEEPENVRNQAVLIKGPDDKIEAMGMYVPSDDSEMPVLVWQFANGNVERRYYEQEYAQYIGKEV